MSCSTRDFSEQNDYNTDEAHIFVPKRFAQKARQYLSNENLFLNHKSFVKCRVKETEEDALGIPIKYAEMTEVALDKVNPNSQFEIAICEKLAKYLSINPELVQIKLPQKNLDDITSEHRNELQLQYTQSKRKCPPNSYERLKRAYVDLTNDSTDEKLHDVSDVPKHWEIHDDLILFPPDSFKNIMYNQNSPNPESIYSKLCDMICDIFAIKRIAIKCLGGIQNDDFRSPSMMLVHGFNDDKVKTENYSTWAKRTENGIIQTWDITKSMFCVGNITEKLRVAKFNCQNEVVVDLFAGIGYFVLPYLVHAKAQHVFACEWNPTAVKALNRNLKLNRIDESRYTILEGDNRVVAPTNVADRVNLGLIPNAAMSYKTAVFALKDESGGILHIHANVRRSKQLKNSGAQTSKTINCKISLPSEENSFNVKQEYNYKEQIIIHSSTGAKDTKYTEWIEWSYNTAEEIGRLLFEKDSDKFWELTIMHIEHVKAFSPFVDHLVLDLKCTPRINYPNSNKN